MLCMHMSAESAASYWSEKSCTSHTNEVWVNCSINSRVATPSSCRLGKYERHFHTFLQRNFVFKCFMIQSRQSTSKFNSYAHFSSASFAHTIKRHFSIPPQTQLSWRWTSANFYVSWKTLEKSSVFLNSSLLGLFPILPSLTFSAC